VLVFSDFYRSDQAFRPGSLKLQAGGRGSIRITYSLFLGAKGSEPVSDIAKEVTFESKALT
jgi:hypothetical protein